LEAQSKAVFTFCAFPANWSSQYIIKKYVRRIWSKKGASLADTPKLAPRHAIESRVLNDLELEYEAVLPTSSVFRFQLESHTPPPSSFVKTRVGTANTSGGRAAADEMNNVNAVATGTRPMTPGDSNCEDHDPGTIRPNTPSSFDSSVILTVNVDIIESPLEWSARMKRYQEEEIEYLGLKLVRPRIPEYSIIGNEPQGNLPRRAVCVPSYIPAPRQLILSKERFEEWLDTLSPRASPIVPASQSSTVAEPGRISNSSSAPLATPASQAKQNRIPSVQEICSECRKEFGREKQTRESGVQTDISGGLISI
jgi:hypothetical protein